MLNESGYYCFIYTKQRQNYIVINGNEFGPYLNINDLRVKNSGKYRYSYMQDDYFYVNISGEVLGPFEQINNISMNDDGDYRIYFTLNDKFYVIISQIVFGPFDKSFSSFKISPENHKDFCFKYNEGVNINGKEYFSNPNVFWSNNCRHFFSYDNFSLDLIIDGIFYYNSGGFRYVFVPEQNSVKWISLYGRDILLNISVFQ